ncbi:uncharacterized protein M6B38_109755 [Iris pallida]|uniref:Uncharacterized protein n=1 Tax=Iris pallida TaxID=29817 RepID=A0AAX6E8H4_IRIPA|nr:Uncharacterized protein M6B38_224480 [Iris pallida]KAJ6800437.1 uncharacterized protein M6B38_109755 [Iris pallida]
MEPFPSPLLSSRKGRNGSRTSQTWSIRRERYTRREQDWLLWTSARSISTAEACARRCCNRGCRRY